MTPAGQDDTGDSAPATRRRAVHFNAGFLTNRRVRRILTLAGYDLALGKPGPGDDVLVWGHSPYAPRGEAAAEAAGAPLVRVEDAFLRGLFPGRTGEPPLGLVIDRRGIYFDASQPSDLEHILSTHALDDTALLDRARAAMARIAAAHLTKYSAVDPNLVPPDPGYVLVIDQTEGDASVRLGGADRDSFREMLYWAGQDFPASPIVVKAHPETAAGHRPGHFTQEDLDPYGDRLTLLDGPHSPQRLFEGAVGVYTVTSQMGFDAILAGHRPVTFGAPFYAGWDLTDDRRPVARRGRRLTRAQLVAACLILYPTWYDPYGDRIGRLEDALGALEAEARAWREDRDGHAIVRAWGWKRPHMRRIFGQHGRVAFVERAEEATKPGLPVLVWAGAETDALRQAAEGADLPLLRVEDGFLRSRGLGAELVPPLSLVTDDLGIYFDPARASRLEALIAEAARLRPPDLARAEALIEAILAAGLTKYSTGGPPDLPEAGGRLRLLVPGQVEDDASILAGTREVSTNLALLEAARTAFPDAQLIYKPHPDFEAGLRRGTVSETDLDRLADHVARETDPAALLGHVDHVATMTSGIGFEALLRGVPVTTFGTPFYAGWGLTDDRGAVPARRRARPSVAALAHATLIAYPRYFDPVTMRPCPPEVAIDRLAAGIGMPKAPLERLLARAQVLRGRITRALQRA
ncbi:capsular polysaccharide biosynthesis protein [Rhodobacterales bacterium HKCCE3408]|nr:capsular polysaccharide biosynthesis protein [Rhodobacterales bacterium HKCCE3408]